MSINRVMISGNLTRDAELRATGNGGSVLNVSVAVNDRYKDASGNWKDRPNFIECTMFGNRAQAVSRYLTKGTKVAIEGRLHYSQWNDRESGKNRSKIDVTIDEIEFMSRSDGGSNREYQQQNRQYRQQEITGQDAYSGEDIPF